MSNFVAEVCCDIKCLMLLFKYVCGGIFLPSDSNSIFMKIAFSFFREFA